MSPGESESLWPLLLSCGVWTLLSPARGAAIPVGRVCAQHFHRVEGPRFSPPPAEKAQRPPWDVRQALQGRRRRLRALYVHSNLRRSPVSSST